MAFLHGVEVVEIAAGNRPIRLASTSVIGLIGTAPGADVEAFPLNTPVLVAGNRTQAAALDVTVDGTGGGTLPAAIDGIFDQIGAAVVVVRVDEGADEAATIANVVGGVDPATEARTGVQVFLDAQSEVGQKPRILIAPGFTHQRPEDVDTPGTFLANPVVSELLGIAGRLRSIIVADGPSTTDADALAYANDFGSARVYLVDPFVKVLQADGTFADEPASARVAGVIARTDTEQGFFVSPSNKTINGISGISRPIEFTLGDENSQANLLNAANATTIIREQGFRLWGNRTLSIDPKFAFLSVRRIADILNDSLLQGHLFAVDRNITRGYLDEVSGSVNGFIRTLIAQGALLGGRANPSPDLNTPETIAAGQVFFDFEFTPPAPAERITFRSILTDEFFSEVII